MKKALTTFFICLFVTLAPLEAKTTEEFQREIDELEKRVASLKTQALTLVNQVAYYDSQIVLNETKISQTEDLIGALTGKIGDLETLLERRTWILAEQVAKTYKSRQYEPVQLFLSSRSFSEFMHRAKYWEVVQAYNRGYIHDTQVAQTVYVGQKDLLVESQKRLEMQKAALAAVRIEKDNLLKQTKNSEAVYQKQLEQAKLELEAIQLALVTATRVGPVKAGEPIALTGNSGYPSCSTGKHLHFEVRDNNAWVNAESYLKPLTDKWGLRIGSGKWDWPLKGELQITQRYGRTPYSYRYAYSGGVHTGIDMLSDSDVVYAPADGVLYAATEKCGSSQLKLKFIDHGNNLKTLYLHVQ